MVEKYKSPNGSQKVIWAVAISDGPVTAKEVAEMLPDSDSRYISKQLAWMHDLGLLVRQIRETNNIGSNPYEYTLWYPNDEQTSG